MQQPRNQKTLKRVLLTAFTALFFLTQTAQAASRYVFIHTDMLGSPMATTDERGNIISRENVTPYGDSLGKRDASNSVAVGSPEHGSGYTGHVRDRDLGLTYMQARYYDPTIGRFMGVDPVGFLDTRDPAYFNRYAYAKNNPYKYIDPDGAAFTETQNEMESPNYSPSFGGNMGGGGGRLNGGSTQLGTFAAGDILSSMGDNLRSMVGDWSFGGISALGALSTKSYKNKASIGDGVVAKKADKPTDPPVQQVDPKNLIPTQTRNEISGSQVKRLKKDMQTNGFDQSEPVDVVKNSRGRLEIEDGHHRTEAAKKAGLDKIPVRVWGE